MSLKLFLKPSIAKIIISLLIFVIFVPFVYYDTGIRCIKAPCPAGANGSIVMWLFFSYNFHLFSISYVILIIGILLSYLVSCLILFAINKIKNNLSTL